MHHHSPTSEETPLLRVSPASSGISKSYSHNDIDSPKMFTLSFGSTRPQSVPVLSNRVIHGIEVSPFFAQKFFMAQGGTIMTSAFNLASATLGAGVLALPRAMQDSGVVTGTAVLGFICALTVYSCFLLVSIGQLLDLDSFESLSSALIGPWSEKLVAFIIVVFCWGVAVMYVVVMGDFIQPFIPLLGLETYVTKREAMFVFWALLMLPFSLARRINSLRYASFVGCIATLILAVTLVIKVAVHGVVGGTPLVRWGDGSLRAFSTFSFSYCCTPVVFQVYKELKRATVGRLSLSASISMASCTAIYVVTGIFGALSYGTETSSNILKNFAPHLDLPYVQLAYLGMAITVTMAMPMTIFPTRESVVLALGFNEDSPSWIHSLVGGVLALLALLVGMYVPNITVLFDLLGGICGGSLAFFLPGFFALRSDLWEPEDVGMLHHLAAWVLTLFGLFMCVLGTYNSVVNNFFVKSLAQ